MRSGAERLVVRARAGGIAVEEGELEGGTLGERHEAVRVELADRGQHQLAPVTELTQRPVAVEVQRAANPTGLVIVVDMLRRRLTTDRAHPPCSSNIRARSSELSPYVRRRWLIRFGLLVHGLQ
jgi:hypothetical protein